MRRFLKIEHFAQDKDGKDQISSVELFPETPNQPYTFSEKGEVFVVLDRKGEAFKFPTSNIKRFYEERYKEEK